MMQKIKLQIINKLIQIQATSKEVDFLIYISRFQDDHGIVRGVYYREICEQLNISNQTFYDIKRSLIQKGIIRVFKNNFLDWDIQILNNDFSNKDFSEGYINTNQQIFNDKDFFSMKAGEKLLAMHFLKICHSGRGSYHIGTKKFFEKYTEVFQVSKRVIQNYLTSLRTFFSIGVKEQKYWITPLKRVYKQFLSPSETDNYNRQAGKMILRREKIKDYTEKAFKDTIQLLKQYNDVEESLLKKFEQAVHLSIEKANMQIKNKRKWLYTLQPKLVHKLLRELIFSS